MERSIINVDTETCPPMSALKQHIQRDRAPDTKLREFITPIADQVGALISQIETDAPPPLVLYRGYFTIPDRPSDGRIDEALLRGHLTAHQMLKEALRDTDLRFLPSTNIAHGFDPLAGQLGRLSHSLRKEITSLAKVSWKKRRIDYITVYLESREAAHSFIEARMQDRVALTKHADKPTSVRSNLEAYGWTQTGVLTEVHRFDPFETLNPQNTPSESAFAILTQFVSGLKWMVTRGFVLSDLKPENIGFKRVLNGAETQGFAFDFDSLSRNGQPAYAAYAADHDPPEKRGRPDGILAPITEAEMAYELGMSIGKLSHYAKHDLRVQLIKLRYACLSENPQDRPSVAEILEALEAVNL